MAPPVKSSTTNAQAMQLKLDSEERYKEVNIRLKRLLGEERKNLMQVSKIPGVRLFAVKQVGIFVFVDTTELRTGVKSAHRHGDASTTVCG